MLLSSCASLPPFLSGGTNVAANVPVAIGKDVEQTQGVSIKTGATNTPSAVIRPKARVDSLDQSNTTITNNEWPPVWVLISGFLLFILGWVTDTPHTYFRRWTKRDK